MKTASKTEIIREYRDTLGIQYPIIFFLRARPSVRSASMDAAVETGPDIRTIDGNLRLGRILLTEMVAQASTDDTCRAAENARPAIAYAADILAFGQEMFEIFEPARPISAELNLRADTGHKGDEALLLHNFV